MSESFEGVSKTLVLGFPNTCSKVLESCFFLCRGCIKLRFLSFQKSPLRSQKVVSWRVKFLQRGCTKLVQKLLKTRGTSQCIRLHFSSEPPFLLQSLHRFLLAQVPYPVVENKRYFTVHFTVKWVKNLKQWTFFKF